MVGRMVPARIAALVWLGAALAAAQTPEQLYASGLKSFEQGRAEEAVAELERAVAARPKYAAAWKVLGVIMASQGDFPAAEPYFREACALDAKLPDACFYHGRSLYLVNRFREALAVMDTLPLERRRYRIQALCLDAMGRWSEAEPLYRKAIEVDTGAEDPRVDYGVGLSRQGRADEAVEALKLAVQFGRQPRRAELELGRVFLQLERFHEARPHLEKAVALSPESSAAHLLLGKLYGRLGLPEKAAFHLEIGARPARAVAR